MGECYSIFGSRWRTPNVNSYQGDGEVDETLVGDVQQDGKRVRDTTNSVVAIAVEIIQPKIRFKTQNPALS